MKIVTWNVNGLKAATENGGIDAVTALDADIYCFQETKLFNEKPQILGGWKKHYYHSRRKAYAGLLTAAKKAPEAYLTGLSEFEDDKEARVLIGDVTDFFLANVYFPTFQKSLDRLDYRLSFDEALYGKLIDLNQEKPVILCGDFNTYLSSIDIYPENERMHREDSGLLEDSRDNLLEFMSYGFIDAYRLIYPEETNCYTWWSQRQFRRRVNHGWRLDMFIVSDTLKDSVRDVKLLQDIEGSDHCPVLLDIDI